MHHIVLATTEALGQESALDYARYCERLRRRGLPVIATLGHLSQIVGVGYEFLHSTVQRRREGANYQTFHIAKRAGGRRLIHAVGRDLLRAQRFLNTEVLQHVQPHPASFAYHASGGVRRCAAMHCEARWLLNFDIENFFHRINEIDVYRVFNDLGYRRLLSFELSRLCTTTQRIGHDHERVQFNYPPEPYRHAGGYGPYYFQPQRLGALPQGAPTSPMLSNLVARSLDVRLQEIADRNGCVYTRYGDDVSLSCTRDLRSGHGISHLHTCISQAISAEGFAVNRAKTRVSPPGARKVVLGLLVDGPEPRLTKSMRRRIEQPLYAAKKFGIDKAAAEAGFRSTHGYYNHLYGLVMYARYADPDRGVRYEAMLQEIDHPFALTP